MKKFFKKLGQAFANFFISIGNDFVEMIKNHWLKLFGYLIMFVLPIGYLMGMYIYKKPDTWALPIFVWIPVILLIIIYWMKIRTYLAIKVQAMKVENNIEEGKHAGAIICITFLQLAMTIAPFVLGYFIFDNLEKAMISVRDIFLILSILEGIGALFVLFDTIGSVSKITIEEEENE